MKPEINNNMDKGGGMCAHGNFVADCERCRELHQEWERVGAEVDEITDGLGLEIDKGIKEAVIAINANGLSTSGSCEGHSDRGLPFPWVDVQSKEADKIKSSDEYQSYVDKNRHAVDGKSELTEDERKKYRALIEKVQEANKSAQLEINKLLEEFYASDEKHDDPNQLVLTEPPANRLQPRFGEEAEAKIMESIRNKVPKEEVNENIRNKYLEAMAEARNEMARFTDFLKNKFFSA